MSTAAPEPKRQKPNPDATPTSDQPFELIYWPEIPGRAEHIRLLFEEAGVEYIDTAKTDSGESLVLAYMSSENTGDGGNPPMFASPFLKHGGVTISQTSNILLYVGVQVGLLPAPPSPVFYHTNELILTLLDGLSNEVHDTHHPIAVDKYYEEQKEPALLKAEDFRTERLPKFLGYFERVMSGPANSKGLYLLEEFGVADLVLWQCLDGVKFAFPKTMERLEKTGKYEKVLGLYERVKQRPNIKKYLEGESRQKYSMGIYRYYPELDEQ